MSVIWLRWGLVGVEGVQWAVARESEKRLIEKIKWREMSRKKKRREKKVFHFLHFLIKGFTQIINFVFRTGCLRWCVCVPFNSTTSSHRTQHVDTQQQLLVALHRLSLIAFSHITHSAHHELDDDIHQVDHSYFGRCVYTWDDKNQRSRHYNNFNRWVQAHFSSFGGTLIKKFPVSLFHFHLRSSR